MSPHIASLGEWGGGVTRGHVRSRLLVSVGGQGVTGHMGLGLVMTSCLVFLKHDAVGGFFLSCKALLGTILTKRLHTDKAVLEMLDCFARQHCQFYCDFYKWTL